MASVRSPLRTLVKPLVFKLIGKKGYLCAQAYAKARDIRKRLVEEDEMELLPTLIQSGDDVIDIGANFAYYSVRMAELVDAGKVHAFEPIPFTYQVAERVLKKFGAKQVELYPLGVGGKTERRTFQVPLQDFGAVSAGQAHFTGRNNDLEGKEEFYHFKKHVTFQCDVVKIDDFLLPKLNRLTFVKMDIEGAEFFALEGMKKTLQKFRPAILIEIQPFFLKGFGIEEKNLVDLIFSLGYEIFVYDRNTQKLQGVVSPLQPRNFILLPKERLSSYQNLMERLS